jgi:hypothetical protein
MTAEEKAASDRPLERYNLTDTEQLILDFLCEMVVASSNLAELGFPTSTESNDDHLGRLRAAILQSSTDQHLRREVKFLAAERSAH